MITSATTKTMEIVYLILILGCSSPCMCFHRLLLNRFCHSFDSPAAFLKSLPLNCAPGPRLRFIL